MVEIAYPSPFEQRVLAGEAPGGEPAALSVVVPTIARQGEPVTVRVAVVDDMGLPSLRFDGKVVVRAEAMIPEEVEVPLRAGAPAVGMAAGVRFGRAGLLRLEGRLDGRGFPSNPLRVEADPTERIFWGDPHVHTVLSDCHPRHCRSLEFCHAAGRWLSGLDWVAAADHVSNGRGGVGKWLQQAAACEAFDEPGAYVTLPGYEASLKGGAGGDTNVYMLRWPELFVDEYDDGDVRSLCEKMAGQLEESEFFVVPHHTTRTGKHGEIGDDIYPGPQRMPVVEIHSKWGTSEYRGNPNPLKQVHPGPSYAVDLLNRGLRLGFIGGTDTHTTFPGWDDLTGPRHIDRLPGLTAVRAAELTRRNIFGAIRLRRCYAASGERILLDATVAGAPMGGLVDWPDLARPRRVLARAAGLSRISAVEIVRNGETIARGEPDGWRAELDFTDEQDLSDRLLTSPHLGRFAYYYVRVTCAGGAQAWSSPVWLVGAR